MTYRISNAYEAREWIRQACGKWDASTKSWSLTDQQYESLVSDVETSGTRYNKRDRALWTA